MSELKLLTHVPYAFQPGETVDEIRATASRNQLVFLSFSLIADSDLDVILELTPLVGPAGEQLSCELHVVSVWAQSGLGVYQSAATDVSELLLKSDNVHFEDGYRRRCDSSWHLHRSRRRYLAPKVRLAGDVRTSLAAGKPRQFWVSVDVRAGCAPGEYSGHINLKRKGSTDVDTLVEVEVLPVTLVEPQQDLMLWYRGTLNCHHPHHYVSQSIFTAQLRDIHRHGFRSISFWETDRKRMQRAIDIAHEVGFSGNIVLDAYREKVWSGVDFRGMTPVVYVADEADADPFSQMERANELSEAVRRRNVKTFVSVIHFSSIEKTDADVVSFFLPSNAADVIGSFPGRDSGRAIYYYWQAHMEKPLLHRLLAGVFLWKSGAAGISPYCYQHLPGFPFSPFDDFDSWDPKERAPEGKFFRDHFATYPARDGVIPTLQWKGMADGITDLRYLATREAALAGAEASGDSVRVDKARRIRAKGVEFLDLIQPAALDLLSDSRLLPADFLTAEAFAEMRSSLVDDILDLLPPQGLRPGTDQV